MYYYQHHIGDFDRATRHLTRIERSIYLDLIFQYYETEQALTLDVAALCRKIVARSEDEKAAVLAVLDEFFHETPNGWFHDRCEEEIANYRKTVSQASAAGQASARARAERRNAALKGQSPTGAERRANENPTTVERPLNDRSTDVVQNANEPATNHEPRTINHKPSKATASPLPEWIPTESWNAFVAMRKQIKKPVTSDAIPMAIAKLEKLRSAGHDPKEVLDQSTLNCWQGLFEVKPGAITVATPKKQEWI